MLNYIASLVLVFLLAWLLACAVLTVAFVAYKKHTTPVYFHYNDDWPPLTLAQIELVRSHRNPWTGEALYDYSTDLVAA